MNVIYRNIVEEIIRAAHEAESEMREIDRIEVTKSEFNELLREFSSASYRYSMDAFCNALKDRTMIVNGIRVVEMK